MDIIEPIRSKKRGISSQWHWKLVRFSTTQSMVAKKLLKYQQDIEMKIENVMSKVVNGNIGLKVDLNVVFLGGGPNKVANFSQDVKNWESHV